MRIKISNYLYLDKWACVWYNVLVIVKMKIKKEVEFNDIIKDILKNKEVISLRYELHHGISRLDHLLNVARLTYNICKFFKVRNYEKVIRAAFLHDFYFTSDDVNFKNHPLKALDNAKRVFNVDNMQIDIIYNHMFPATLRIPKYKETWIVIIADKLVAICECMRYKLPNQIGITLVFLFNFMVIQR